MKQPRKPRRETEFQRFARAARRAGLIVSKKAYDLYFRTADRTAAKVKAPAK